MRYGVFGGTFDPPHCGHLRAAEAAREVLGLEGVVFVPAARPPHKDLEGVTEARLRVEMLSAAISANSAFEISEMELERAGPSYTVDTLDRLSRLYPKREWFFIIGSDAFADLPTWKDWRRLLGEYRLALLARPGFSLTEARRILPEELTDRVFASPVDAEPHARFGVYLVEAPLLRVFSSEVRQRVRRGQGVRYLVPEEVRRYISENGLYAPDEIRSGAQ